MSDSNWAKHLRKASISVDSLLNNDLISDSDVTEIKAAKDLFDIRVPHAFLDSIKSGDTTLGKQFVPTVAELASVETELEDPIGDERWTVAEGLTHRYPDRVLLKITYQCASYCRFCFRKYKVSKTENNPDFEELDDAFRYIQAHPEIWEVILTGGDPLVLTNAKLSSIVSRLKQIPSVKIIRIHSRIITVLPTRIDDGLLEILSESGKQVILACHINSVSEISPETEKAAQLLRRANVTLLSQTVLLKGINDDAKYLENMFKTFVTTGIQPYYLFYPDLAKGTHHFRVNLDKAIAIYEKLRGAISGHCIPKFMVDIPGGHGKVELNSNWIKKIGTNQWLFRSPLTAEEVEVNYENESQFSKHSSHEHQAY